VYLLLYEGFSIFEVVLYISGLPVIVTYWKHATEFVEDGKSGFIVPFEDGEELFIKRVTQLEANRDKLMSMKSYAAKKSKEFSPPELRDFIKDWQ
jgi:glycosyltransferase involved in cell wall biosynthesis